VINRKISLLIAIGAAIACTTFGVANDAPPSPGEKFFDEQMLPVLAENNCAQCHAQHYVRPRVLEYRELLPYLGMGTGPKNNVLISKMANYRPIAPNRPSHPGGQRCKTTEDKLCQTIQQWWDVEFGAQAKGAK
jgi:hypothetical protein